MKHKLSASLLMLAVLLLFGTILYVTFPRKNISGALIQILMAAVFAGLLSLLHKIPAGLINAVTGRLPFGLDSTLGFRLATLLVGMTVLTLTLAFRFHIGFLGKGFVSSTGRSVGSEYLIPRLDSFKREFEQIRGVEEMRFKYLEYSDEDFRNTILNRSAFVACVRGDFQQASEFVASGLKWYPQDKELLAIGGLVAYEQGRYPEALANFRQATNGERQARTGGTGGFQATMVGNEGLVRWELGETDQAEEILARSIDLFGKVNAKREGSYLLLNQGKLYADYWQLANATAKNDRALELATGVDANAESLNQQANVSRLKAEIALIQGSLDVARQRVESAINTHLETRSLQYLAQDYEVKAAIQEQAGLQDEALGQLGKAANIYEEAESTKELSENWLKQAKLLLDHERYADAQKLIRNASEEFYRIGYRRGLGEASALEGELRRQRATSKDLNKDNAKLVIDETRKALDLYQKAYDIFQEIGYVRGVADANNYLGLAVIQINKPVGGDTTGEALSDGAFQSARHYLERAAELYRQIGDKRGEANVYGNLGVLYRNRRDYDSALEWLNKAFQIHEEIGFQLGMARQFINIGRVYCAKSDRHKANDYLGRAKEKLTEIEGGYKERKAVDRLCR